MSTVVGLWIDHREAVIVIFDNEVELIRKLNSDIEKNAGENSEVFNDSQGSTAEDMRDRKFGMQLDRYYDEIISIICGADSVLIFGPGEAKVEFQSRMKHKNLEERIVGVETVDKMTDPQIIAKVREYYARKGS